MTYDDMLVYGLTLAETIHENQYTTPLLKTDGRAFTSVGREPRSFGLIIDLNPLEMLTKTDPETYWQTRHYVGWPSVPVRWNTQTPLASTQ